MYLIKKKITIHDKTPHILIIEKIKKSKEVSNDINKIDNKNLKFTKKVSPLSGSELKYLPHLWNDASNIRNSHNCYTYALGKIVPGLRSKAQPGYASGYDHIEDNQYKCSFFRDRLIKDAPGSYIEKFDNKCLPGFYKVFLALDVGNDYHWWRMDDDQFWSHKPGSTNVVNACVYSDLARSLNNIYT